MKKQFLFFAAAALALASCSSENDVVQSTAAQQTAANDVVMFDAYLNRSTTRAGGYGTLSTDGTSGDVTAKLSLKTAGFGVFGYHNNGQPYGETSTPDFMYNQKVTYGVDSWTYSPVKYWPNEFGSTAISDDEDRLTFFAYAPWVNVTPETGRVSSSDNDGENSGIVGFTSNTATGDPYVKYYASFDPAKRVDLCWGVAKGDFNTAVDGSGKNNISAGNPYVDVIKPTTSDKIFFNFKHALAAINVQIDADIDELSHGSTDYKGTETKIWVRSVTFEGFTDKAKLNLNHDGSEPDWYEISSANTKIGSGKVTIYDARRDGKEGQTGAEASNEKPHDLNAQLIQDGPYNDTNPLSISSGHSGVPVNPINLFNNSKLEEPVYVIPTGEVLKVTIVYDVETADDNLAKYLSDGAIKGSTIENNITKTITMGGSPVKLVAGKLYTIGLHLGMTSVKFDAEVTEWGAETDDDTDLPINALAYAAGSTGNSIVVPAAGLTGQKLSINGLTGTTVNAKGDGTVVTSPDNSSGVDSPISAGKAVVTYSVSANSSVKNVTTQNAITVVETGGGATTTKFDITQQAHALNLAVDAVATNGLSITLKSKDATMASGDWTGANINVKRVRNGLTTYLEKGGSTDGQKYSIDEDAGKGKINFGSGTANEVKVGDVYTITVQAGDAAEETVTVKIGGVYFASPVTAIANGANVINPATKVGTGTVGYATSGSNISIDESKVTGLSVSSSANTVTATLSGYPTDASDGYYYTTNSVKADYSIVVTNTSVGGELTITKDATNTTFTICGLPASSTITCTEDVAWITSLTCTGGSNTNGVASITCVTEANSAASSPARSATITINGTLTFTITQGANIP